MYEYEEYYNSFQHIWPEFLSRFLLKFLNRTQKWDLRISSYETK